MNELPQASISIAESVGDPVLGEAVDEHGPQRLISAVIGRAIGIHEEPSAPGGIHGCTRKCEGISVAPLLARRIKKEAPGPAGRDGGAEDQERMRGGPGHASE
jgi:hypothetical protein